MKPTKQQAWVGVVMLALPIAASYFGVEYGQKNPPTPIETTTNVAITALPAGAVRSDLEVKALAKEIADAALNFHVNKSGMH